jgi:hypothetical protein
MGKWRGMNPTPVVLIAVGARRGIIGYDSDRFGSTGTNLLESGGEILLTTD